MFRDSHYKDKTVVRPYYFAMGILRSDTTVFILKRSTSEVTQKDMSKSHCNQTTTQTNKAQPVHIILQTLSVYHCPKVRSGCNRDKSICQSKICMIQFVLMILGFDYGKMPELCKPKLQTTSVEVLIVKNCKLVQRI